MKKDSIFEKDSRKKGKGTKKGELSNQELVAKIEALQRERETALKLTIGLDLGDRSSCYCALDEKGEVRRRQFEGIARQGSGAGNPRAYRAAVASGGGVDQGDRGVR